MFQFNDSRYNRQIQMPEWKDQKLLKNLKVVVIGAGGVKSTLLMALVSSGVGFIRIIEFDKVELSNLNRQLLFKTSDIGKYKGEVAKKFLSDLNPEVTIEYYQLRLSKDNIEKMFDGIDFVVEGGSSISDRNLVNEFCLLNNLPFTHSSAQFNYGYVFSVIPELKTSCFRCLFPNNINTHTGPVPVCVLSTSLAGTLGASEVLKWAFGYHDSMFINKRLCFSSLLLSSEFSYEIVIKNPKCLACS